MKVALLDHHQETAKGACQNGMLLCSPEAIPVLGGKIIGWTRRSTYPYKIACPSSGLVFNPRFPVLLVCLPTREHLRFVWVAKEFLVSHKSDQITEAIQCRKPSSFITTVKESNAVQCYCLKKPNRRSILTTLLFLEKVDS